ncbi:metallophosphoesterase [Paenibacillus sambharensis]|uniref:Metallophosphoesterase n=1 Tax=Paenibacillus sambharensis TaxID=1803190 RepID=A0A2W1LNM6_9BACL|nr:metallophosphoesterase [Paenibacillus sambharensis]PZD96084.1 metallophosphoesterase [Paenibacillus sambharensis]
MRVKQIFLVSLLFLAFAGINYYIGWNGRIFLEAAAPAFPTLIFWILYWSFASAYLIGRSGIVKGPAARLLKVIGSFYFAVLEFSVLLLPLANLGFLAALRIDISREAYVLAAGWTFIAVLLLLLARGWWNATQPVVRQYELSIPKKTEGARQLKIVMASDIHLGNIVGNRHLSKLVKAAERIHPDLILLPGDVIDDVIEPFVRNRMADTMCKLQASAKYGAYAILGNHEYYGGHADEYVQRMGDIGIRVLRDETVTVDGWFHVAGRKDKTAETMEPDGRKTTAQLLAELDKTKPVLLMDHQPYAFDKAAAAGADLLLCGHTHRGQFAPNHLITKRLFELDWGYMMKESMHVIVSSGFGTWGPPVRLASRSEIISITLKFTG